VNAHYLLWFTRSFDRLCIQAQRRGVWLSTHAPDMADRARHIHREVEQERIERSRHVAAAVRK